MLEAKNSFFFCCKRVVAKKCGPQNFNSFKIVFGLPKSKSENKKHRKI